MNWSTWIKEKVYLRLKNALSVFFNTCCELCLEPNLKQGFLCSDCKDALPRARYCCDICALPLPQPTTGGSTCGECLKVPPAFDYSHSNFIYSAPIAGWLYRLKNKRQTQWAHKLASLMLLNPPLNLEQVDAFTFVPSTRWHLIKRGFNPAELIARALACSLNKPVLDQLTVRHHSREQKELSRRQRLNNVKDHFHATGKHLLNGEHILLIDDVMTTGSTAHTIAKLLKDSGASKVGIWCLARTPKP